MISLSGITRSKCENFKSFRYTHSVKFLDEKLEEFYWVYNCTHWAWGWYCTFYSKILNETKFIIKYIIVGLHFLSVLIHFLFWVLITVHMELILQFYREFSCPVNAVILTIAFWTMNSVQFSHSVVSASLWPHGLQHARLPCPSSTPGACSNSMSIKSVMPSNHLILCHPLLLLPSIFPSIRVFSFFVYMLYLLKCH